MRSPFGSVGHACAEVPLGPLAEGIAVRPVAAEAELPLCVLQPSLFPERRTGNGATDVVRRDRSPHVAALGKPCDLAGELLVVDTGDRVPPTRILRLGELDEVRGRLHAAIVTSSRFRCTLPVWGGLTPF